MSDEKVAHQRELWRAAYHRYRATHPRPKGNGPGYKGTPRKKSIKQITVGFGLALKTETAMACSQ
jgi:hypothetical protein